MPTARTRPHAGAQAALLALVGAALSGGALAAPTASRTEPADPTRSRADALPPVEQAAPFEPAADAALVHPSVSPASRVFDALSAPGDDQPGPANVDGMSQVSFAQEGEDFDPVLTPDGRSIVFASTQYRRTSDLFIKPVRSRVVTQLTNEPGDDVMPAVSPDGTRVAFASNRSGRWALYVMPISGGKAVQLTDEGASDLHPSWSPDGQRLVFCRLGEVSRRWELWVLEVSNPSTLNFLGYGALPEWSPVPATGHDGADRILFQLPRERGSRTFGIWTLDYKDGNSGQATAIATSADSALINPTWSRDGRHVVYAQVPAGSGPAAVSQAQSPQRSDLWMVAVDGSARVRLTDAPTIGLMPHWGPGEQLVFFSPRDGRGNIWSMDLTRAVAALSGASPTRHAAAPSTGASVDPAAPDAPVQSAPATAAAPTEQP